MSILFAILGAIRGFIGSVVNWFTTGNVKAKLITLSVIAALIVLFVLYGKYVRNAEKVKQSGKEIACLQTKVGEQNKEAKKTGESIGVTDVVTKDNTDEKGTVVKKATQVAEKTNEKIIKAGGNEKAKDLAMVESLWDTYCLAGTTPIKCQIKE